jgi:hypothetical protein
MNTSTLDFIKLAKHPVKFRMFLFLHIPSAFFSWIKIKGLTPEVCKVSVPFSWFTKNPFHSTYFACLSMGAELSTGALVMLNTYQRRPVCSMLVTDSNATFVKKATGTTIFTCEDGIKISQAIETAYLTNQPQIISVRTVGKNIHNEVIAIFEFVWSVKVK